MKKKNLQHPVAEKPKEVAGPYDRWIVGGDFASRLRGHRQRAVFNRLFGDSGPVGWLELRERCWPRTSQGKIDEKVTAAHVRDVISQIQEKAKEFSKGRHCIVSVELADTNSWKVEFSFANPSNVTGQRPQFSWGEVVAGKSAQPKEQRSLPVWVPVLAENNGWIDVNFLVAEPWRFPLRGFDYAKFSKEKWTEFQNKRRKDGLPPASNTPHWHVRGCIPRALEDEPVRMSFIVCRAEFADYVATTLQLDTEIEHNGNTKQMRQHLYDAWTPRADNGYFPKAANLLAVDVNILTTDKKLVVRREQENDPWQTAIFGFVNALQDVHRGEIAVPSPRETVFRKSCELLGFNIFHGDVRWIGAGMQTQTGNVSIIGELEVPYTSKQLNDFFHSRSDVTRSHELEFIDPTGQAIRDLFGPVENNHRRRAEVAVALSVARRDAKVKVLD